MADLAVEELSHYREVLRVMTRRNVQPGADVRDPYVRGLNDLIRRGRAEYLLDRLLVAAVVERRGHERFGLLADALETRGDERELAAFYRAITNSEDRHWQQFVQLAEVHCDPAEVGRRLPELVVTEAQIMLSLPVRAALH